MERPVRGAPRGRWVPWLLVWAGWTALAIFFATASSLTFIASYQPPRWDQTLTLAFAEWYVWAALTPLVVWLGGRFPFGARTWLRSALVHAPAGFVFAVLKVTLTRIIRAAALGEKGEYIEISSLATHYVIYCSIVAAAHGVAYYRAGREREIHASQLEARLADTRLQLLKMQLHPHFLFNTLNAIAELVHEDPDAADRMIAGLSDLLRATLDAGAVDEVDLQTELTLLARYLEIQQARFGDRLQVRIDAGQAEKGALVPFLVLQPLVENAISHGLAARKNAGRIEIRARRRGQSLVIDIEDDGAGVEDAEHVRNGVGLGNTRARLSALYGAAQNLDVTGGPGLGTLVRLTIPWHVETAPRAPEAS
jgi:two-component system, LytTR family, sensor kinase